jgi:hypothetical protein
MPTESVDIIFRGEPSSAVNAAKKVTEETNKISKSGNEASRSFSQIGDGVARIRNRIGQATLAITAFGAAAYALIRPFKRHVEEAEKLSRALEISYEKAQELTIAEKEAGLAVGSIREAIEGIARAQAQGIISPALLDLGLSFEQINQAKPDQLFDILSKKFSQGSLTAKQFQAAVDIMGSSGSEVILKMAGNFEQFRDIARNSGKIIADETFGKIIHESEVFLAQIKSLADEITKAITPFEDFAQAVAGSFSKINTVLEDIRFGFLLYVNYQKNLAAGMEDLEAREAAAIQSIETVMATRSRVEAVKNARQIGAGLDEERAQGAVDLLDFLESRTRTADSEVSSLQRVGLAATGGESEGIRLQRRQLVKADNIINQLIRQTNVIETTL